MKKFLNKHLLLKTLLTLLLLVGLSLLLTWLLEFRHFSGDATAVNDFLVNRPRVFLFNAWLMLLILVFISSLVGSVFRGAGLTATGILIIGYIHINKFASRGQPLLPEDFQLASQAAALSKFVSVDSLVNLVIAIIAVLIAGEVLERWVGHHFISVRSAKQIVEAGFASRHLIFPRLAAAIVATLLFVTSSTFIWHHRGDRSEYIEFLDTTFTAWNQAYNYDDNGFLIGFLYNWSKFEQEPPEAYNEESIQEIKTHYEQLASDENASKKSLQDADYNLVIILEETFIDPATVEQYYPHSGGDITPNLHRLMAEYPSGYMYSTDYGGGTANIEFEVLTGLTNYWLNTVPYTSIIPRLEQLPSIASLAKENSYSTTAVHAYNGGMYKRNISLVTEGFDEFITDAEYTHRDHEGSSEYINDRSTFAEILDLLKKGNGRQLIFGITMQNHTPYNPETYTEHDFALASAPNGDTARGDSIETYYQSIHAADTYIGEFIDALSASDQKTVVLLFGDHAPGLLTELNTSTDATEFAASRRTPYFIYSNFDLEASDLAGNLPTTTPNCLVNTTLNLLGVKKPALGYLLDEVCTEQPILTSLYFRGQDPAVTGVLKSYQLVTYDLLNGKQYWLK